MENGIITKQLKSAGLKTTPLRESVLQLFSKQGKALNSHQIIAALDNTFDRVSVFRTINTFVQAGIIHAIPTTTDFVYYSICGTECDVEKHRHKHIHFVCSQCGSIFCIQEIPPITISLPEHFVEIKKDIIVEGICKECNLGA